VQAAEQAQREAQARQQLASMCENGFQFIREATGYRCAGRGHFVPF